MKEAIEGHVTDVHIGGFRGGTQGAQPPLYQNILYNSTHSNRPGDRFIKCSLILFSEMLTLLYFASRICPQCCMLHVLKSEVFIWGGGRVWGTRTPLFEFSGSSPGASYMHNPRQKSWDTKQVLPSLHFQCNNNNNINFIFTILKRPLQPAVSTAILGELPKLTQYN